jgi:serine/threonine protein kinase
MTVRTTCATSSYERRLAAVTSAVEPRLHHSCSVAEKLLEEKATETGLKYFKKKEIQSDHDLIINFDNKSYTLLKTGELKEEGVEKKVCSATKITLGVKENEEEKFVATAKSMVRLLSKPGVSLSEREFAYDKKYGQVEDRMIYRDKNDKYRDLYLKDAYDHPAFFYTMQEEFTKEGTTFPPCEIISTILPVAKKLEEMHADGVFHRDVKGLNILCKHNEQKNDTAILIDFGLTASAQEPELLKSVYGTPVYTAPERLSTLIAPVLANEENQRKAEDMYALGCVLYELVYETEIPWAEYVKNYLQNPKMTFSGMKSFDDYCDMKFQLGDQKEASGVIAECLIGLLCPDPSSRMTAARLVEKLSSVKEKTAKINLSHKRCKELVLCKDSFTPNF